MNHVYRAMVIAVIAAKSQPNLYVWECIVIKGQVMALARVITYQDSTNHRDFQSGRYDTENDG